jgi:multiple sugar transport system permease protein
MGALGLAYAGQPQVFQGNGMECEVKVTLKARKYFLLFPALVVIAVTSTYPLIYSFWLASRRWLISESPAPQFFVGFENFQRALTDSGFLMVARTSFIYTAISVLMSVVLGLAIALILQKPGIMTTLTKTLLIFPFAISPALKGYTFRYMLNPETGILNSFINYLFPVTKDLIWLGNTGWALFWLAMTEVWGWAPLVALMFLGALGSISTSIFEAAKLDGTNNVQLFFRITLPLLMPIVLTITLLRTIFSLKMFDQVVTMTNGGPGGSTQTFNYLIYQTGFRFMDMGYAAAMASVLVVIMAIISSLYVKSLANRGM